MNRDEIDGNWKQPGGKGILVAIMTALVALAASASLAFITVAQAQQPPKKPAAAAAPAARPAPPPRAAAPAARPAPAPRAAAPVARPAPAPRAIARPSSPPPQRIVTRPPPQRIVTRPAPVPRTAIPNRPVTSPQITTTRVHPNVPPQRTATPSGPIETPRSGQRTMPQGPRGPSQVGQVPTGVGPHGPFGTQRSGQRTIPRGPQGPTTVGLSPTGLRFGPHEPIATPDHLRQGPNALRQSRFPAVAVNNRFFPIVRGEKFMHLGGRNRFFVPLGALGTVLIGGSYWDPDGYVSTAAPFCTGYTPDGCQLHWRMVDFVDGGGEPQCVQYCPVAGPPPAQVATLPPPPPLLSRGSCQMTIFSDPNFAGTSAPTGDNQPNLSESGWQNEISSVQVQSGTWDFFTDDDYGGTTMRLTTGSYPTLTPDWNKKINSFMCVEPGPGA